MRTKYADTVEVGEWIVFGGLSWRVGEVDRSDRERVFITLNNYAIPLEFEPREDVTVQMWDSAGEPIKCRWQVSCDKDAETVRAHPHAGYLPICTGCKCRAEIDDQRTKAARRGHVYGQ
ncbi:hypothetical protein [Streptomyces sp. NPDC002644]